MEPDFNDTVRETDIAIIGLSGRFPGAPDLTIFWQNLCQGRESVSFFSDEELVELNSALFEDPDYVKAAAVLPGVENFDAAFFGYSPKEAQLLDPQQRIFLECAWSALEDAGYDPAQHAGPIGVYAGKGMNTYLINHVHPGVNYSPQRTFLETIRDLQVRISNDAGFISTQVSYKLDLHGPSINIQSACSTALVAVHSACQSLLTGECDMALAGAVSIQVPQNKGYLYQQDMIFSPDGHCRAFDARAQGTVFGNGAGVVVLKLLSAALEDGDEIYATIKGTAINNDGAQKVGYTAPSISGQRSVIRDALFVADVDASTISYVEAHGTGTALGDPIEITALTQAFDECTDYEAHPQATQRQQCAIGSVKTNIGHLAEAAGMAGLIKTVLALKHGQIPPTLHYTTPNPQIDFANSPFHVNAELREWRTSGVPRRAGVSAFGMGGTNAHIVLEEAPPIDAFDADAFETEAEEGDEAVRPYHLLPLSAKTAPALAELARRYADHLQNHPDLSPADLCFTAATGRQHFAHRLAVVGQNTADLCAELNAIADQPQETFTPVAPPVAGTHPQRIAFLFTGQGSQYVGMGRELYESEPVFRDALDTCDEILQPLLGLSVLEIIFKTEDDAQLDQTQYTQPALFALEYALAQLWQSWGITPQVVMGHSVGEYVAACIAGVFSLADGLRLIAERGRLMQQTAPGSMAAVAASQETVQSAIDQHLVAHRAAHGGSVVIAAINGPTDLVIAGDPASVEALCATLTEGGVKTKALAVSHAFHSPLMEPILPEFARVARGVLYHPPQIPLISNVTGTLCDDTITTPDYWVRHIRQPVQFAAGVAALGQQEVAALIEVGPKPTLLGMGRASLPDFEGPWLPSLRPKRSDCEQMLQSLGALYGAGFAIEWEALLGDGHYRRLHLPTYPFQRERYWIDAPRPTTNGYGTLPSAGESAHPLLGHQLDLAGSQETRFKSHIRPNAPTYLVDHRIADAVLLPMTGYLEMALSAGRQSFHQSALRLEEVFIQDALILPENDDSDEDVALELVLQPESNGRRAFSVYARSTHVRSTAGGQPVWTEHATGLLAPVAEQIDSESLASLAALQEACTREVSAAAWYARAAEQGLQYGPTFQGIQRLWYPTLSDTETTETTGTKAALAHIELPEALDAAPYQIHPAIFDAALQVLVAAISNPEAQGPDDADAYTYLPMGMEQMTLLAPAGRMLWSHAQIRPQASEHLLLVDLTLFDEEAQPVAVIRGLSVRRIARAQLQTRAAELDAWKHELVWQPQPASAAPATPSRNGHHSAKRWLIFADGEAPNTQGGSPQTLGETLAAELTAGEDQAILVSAGSRYAQLAADRYQINPADPTDFVTLLQDIGTQSNTPLHGVIHLGSLKSAGEESEPQAAQRESCGSVLHLVQALAQRGSTPRLWLVTQNAQSVGAPAPLNVAQAPLWGMGRVIALEHAELRPVCIDLPAGEQDVATLLQEIYVPDEETQIAYRRGVRHAARIVRSPATVITVPTTPYGVTLSLGGMIEQLGTTPLSTAPLAANEVEIDVRATGLNFRDVLRALGMLDDPPAQAEARASQRFGYECAGVITRVGESVGDFAVGDGVLAFAKPSLASTITVPTDFITHKPTALTFAEGATIPVTFLTVYYGLHHLAGIKPGDRVLIHAAAGGVGQAAVQICQQAGAEIFATASPGKWALLRKQGISHIYNSRNTAFAEQILADTDGAGVDIVLNSLNDEFITKSVAVLAEDGCFLELGRRGIWTEAQMRAERPHVRYYPFELGDVADDDPTVIRNLFGSLTPLFEEGALHPLPHQIFSMRHVVSAFQTMQQARHIGKVVITQEAAFSANETGQNGLENNALPVPLRSDGSYLITGGLGGLGLAVAEWLAAHGAGYLVLAGRRGAESPGAQEAVQRLEAAGATVQVLRADVAQAEDVARLVETCQRVAPLRGVIHAAGVLADGILTQQRWENFERVLAPKVQGAWHLHSATADLPLDFFVCFSSLASLLGSAGQSNYAAANAFLDGLAHHRRALGLPALSINWGAWAEHGMAANLSERDRQRLTALGLGTIATAEGLGLLADLLGQGAPQMGGFPMDWAKWLGQFAKAPATLEAVAPRQAVATEAPQQSVRQQLEEAPIRARRGLLLEHVRSAVGSVLGLGGARQLDPHQGFFDYGMDSLTSIELRNLLQRSLECSLSQTLAFTYPTTEALVDYLADEILPFDFVERPVAREEDNAQQLEAEMGQLSDEDIESLLLKELEELDL